MNDGGRERRPRWRRWLDAPLIPPTGPWLVAAAVALTALGLVHALVVAPRYHVGSFDDDAGYIMAAQALASGKGLTSILPAGLPLIAVYPAGYPALLAPLVLLGASDAGFRALSLVLAVALFPLVWQYLTRRHVSPGVRLGVLGLLALNPVLATYATMVMAELAFVVVFIVLLLLVDRWGTSPTTISRAGVGAVLCAAALLWVKEAGAGLVIGLVLWLLLRRAWRKAAFTIAGVSVLFAPVLIARASAGTSLVGSRYSTDFGTYYSGGLLHRIVHVVPQSFSALVSTAVPWSLVPTGSPLPTHGLIWYALDVLRWTAAPLVAIGMVAWFRNHRDAALVMVVVYTAEVLTYPFINERRLILVLPLIVGWYVLGAATAGQLVVAAARRAGTRWTLPAARVLMAGVVLVPLLALEEQFTRDYLFAHGQSSSSPQGSPYMNLLRALGHPSDVVETPYRFTTALYSGHRTATTAFAVPCDPAAVLDAVHQDRAGFLLSAALNKPDVVASDCVLGYASSEPWAVRLYRTQRDLASVFDVIGPGSPHPQLTDLGAAATVTSATSPVVWTAEAPQSPSDQPGHYPSVTSNGTSATLTWSWTAPVAVAQVSLGAARASGGERGGVAIDLQDPGGQWRRIASSSTAVGDGYPTPWLLASLASPVAARAVRVQVNGVGSVEVHDLHVLGGSL